MINQGIWGMQCPAFCTNQYCRQIWIFPFQSRSYHIHIPSTSRKNPLVLLLATKTISFKHPIKSPSSFEIYPHYHHRDPVTSHQYPFAARFCQVLLGIESADPLQFRSGVAGESVSVEDNATACQARCFRTGCFKGSI